MATVPSGQALEPVHRPGSSASPTTQLSCFHARPSPKLTPATILPLAEPHFIAPCHAFLTARLASSPDTPLMMVRAGEMAAWKMHVEAWNLFVACDNRYVWCG